MAQPRTKAARRAKRRRGAGSRKAGKASGRARRKK